MLNINDLKNALGEADDGFKNNVYQTLVELKKREERKPVRKMSLRIVAIVTVLCLLATGTALAMTNTWGILDFLNGRRIDVEVLPDATEIVQTDLPQEGGENKLAVFSVREAVFDGQNVYIIVEAKAKNPEYLLLGLDANLSDPVGNMGPLFDGQRGTIDDYAKVNYKTPIHTSVLLNLNGSSVDFVLEDDGTLVYMINGRYADNASQLSLELECITSPFVDGSIHMEDLQRNTLVVTLQNTGTKDIVTNMNTTEYADCGVRVDKITLSNSPMAIYVEIEFSVIDQNKFAETDGGLWFEFIDENGDRLPSGAGSSGIIEALDENGIYFIQRDSLRASEDLPSEITLRGYNAWEKNRYEAHTFEMK